MQIANATSRGTPSYLDEIRRFPMLKAEEEYLLSARWRDGGDVSAAHRLLTSHLRLVAKIALGYRRYGLSTSDLISEGNIGLMRALKRFEREKGVRFSTYAVWWVKAAIQEYVLRSWSLVRIGTTVNQKKLFFNLAKAKRRLSAFQEGDLRPEQVSLIAAGLGVAANDVVAMNHAFGDLNWASASAAGFQRAGQFLAVRLKRQSLGLRSLSALNLGGPLPIDARAERRQRGAREGPRQPCKTSSHRNVPFFPVNRNHRLFCNDGVRSSNDDGFER